MMDRILVDSVDAAELLSVGERSFYLLLKRHPDLAKRARVVLGARVVRYRVEVLREFVTNLAESEPLLEPERLRKGRIAKRARRAGRVERDAAAGWVPERRA